MTEVSDIATDPTLELQDAQGGRTFVIGTRDGIDIKVVFESAAKGGGIVSAYAINRPLEYP